MCEICGYENKYACSNGFNECEICGEFKEIFHSDLIHYEKDIKTGKEYCVVSYIPICRKCNYAKRKGKTNDLMKGNVHSVNNQKKKVNKDIEFQKEKKYHQNLTKETQREMCKICGRNMNDCYTPLGCSFCDLGVKVMHYNFHDNPDVKVEFKCKHEWKGIHFEKNKEIIDVMCPDGTIYTSYVTEMNY